MRTELAPARLTTSSRRASRRREARVVVIGLDDAGKTHILQTIADNELQLLKPTHGFGIMSLLINGFTLNLWDIGGGQHFRGCWRNYLDKTNALIYVVDASQECRLRESVSALADIINDPRLFMVPLLLFNNKVDLFPVLDVKRIMSEFRPVLRGRNYCIFPSSARTGQGIEEGFSWLIEQLDSPSSAKKMEERAQQHKRRRPKRR